MKGRFTLLYAAVGIQLLCIVGFFTFKSAAAVFVVLAAISICICLCLTVMRVHAIPNGHICILCLTETANELVTIIRPCNHVVHADCYAMLQHFGSDLRLGTKCLNCFSECRAPYLN